MTSDNRKLLILPELHGNLEGLAHEEERIRTLALLEINASEHLCAHIDIVHESMNMLYPLIHDLPHRSDDELTMQLLGVRLFNATASALALLLRGYYQNAAGLIRDIGETGFLIDYLDSNPAEVSAWRNSTDDDRRKRFAPKDIRKALDTRDGYQGRKRGQIYALLSKHASHATYSGFQLLAPDGLVKVGPFFDAKRLQAVLEELVKRLPFFTLVYLGNFHDVPPEFLKANWPSSTHWCHGDGHTSVWSSRPVTLRSSTNSSDRSSTWTRADPARTKR